VTLLTEVLQAQAERTQARSDILVAQARLLHAMGE
jgi:outer membrane protein TolC